MTNTIETVNHGLDFTPLHESMRSYVERDILSCCSTLVLRGTDVLDCQTFGYMDVESKAPLRTDAIYRIYSNTKIVTSVALMMLYEQGKFTLDDPLSRFMPEFGDMRVLRDDAASADDVEDARSEILMRHILSHSAGFSYGFIEPESVIDQAYAAGGVDLLSNFSVDLEEFCNGVASLPLAYQPGTDWRYSVATDVCARMVEVLSGQKFDAYLKQHIFEPLGMQDTDFWVPPEKAERFITMYAPVDLLDPVKPGLIKADDPAEGAYNSRRNLLSGGCGLVSTLADYTALIRMIVNGGEWNGARILQPETLALMRTNQLADGVYVRFPMWEMTGTVFGLGFALRQNLQDTEPPGAQDEYHWGGMAGTHSWMAPGAGITGMCWTQRMPGFWHPFSHEFRALTYKISQA